jgi:hypothetical protein
MTSKLLLRPPNTDGIGNYLRQPGQLHHRQIELCEELYYSSLNFGYRDHSCYRDNNNRAAGRRAAVMVFAMLPRPFYRYGITPAHIPGFITLTTTS